MNLIHDNWILIQRSSGKIEYISPYQITVDYKTDPIISLITPRLDFKGALIQLLIGLLQTAFSDLQHYQWRTWGNAPPTPEELKAKFSRFTEAFEINNKGPAFMQDLELVGAEYKPIGSLLIEQPGENTLKNNADHFIKRAQVNALCPTCTVVALFTLQLNAPSGGAGHRTSIRGGGPLTTLILEKAIDGKRPTLWENLWLNVRASVSEYKISESDVYPKIFPWLAPTRTSEAKTGSSTTIEDAHPLQMFWAMPRRIRLDFETTVQGYCDICGMPHEQLLTQYMTKNYGIDYKGEWRHPLSPYSQKAECEWLPTHPQPGGIGYKHWLSLTLGVEGKNNKRPAAVISDYLYEQGRLLPGEQLQLWAFGYDMDNMKARCWYESQLPFIHINRDYTSEFQEAVNKLLEAAEQTLSYTRSVVKKANGDINRLEMAFWHETEERFYNCLEKIKQALETGQALLPINQAWYSMLHEKSVELFNQITMADLIKKAKFYNELKRYLQGKKLQSILELPISKETKNAVSR